MKTLTREDIDFMAVQNPEGFLQLYQRGIISREEFMAEVEALEKRASQDQSARDSLLSISRKLKIGQETESGKAAESAETGKPDQTEAIRKLCERFIAAFGEERFLLKGSALVRGLRLPDDEVIYLGHDDSLFHNGQCGFAITSGGIYCRMFAEKKVRHLTFDALGRDSTAHFIGDTLYSCGEPVAFISGADRELKDALIELIEAIQKIVKGEELFSG